MGWIWNIILLPLIVSQANAADSNGIEKFEQLITYVQSLELKLNHVENKLSKVENQLEIQIKINEKQDKESQEQRKRINNLESRNRQFEKSVEKTGQQNENMDRFLQRIIDNNAQETKANITSRIFRRDGKHYTSGHNDISSRFVNQDVENIAFSAFLNRDLSNLGPGHTIQYGATVINEGNAFNVNTGIFTVPVNGVYIFFFACEDYHNHRIYADIVVDGNRKSLILEGGSSMHSMGANMVILRLTKGQTVWVAIDVGGSNDYLQNSATTFSGVLLYY